MSFSYDDKNDAHKLSNYKEWKKTSHVVTDVQINIKTTGISYDDAIVLINCMDRNTPFVLYKDNVNVDNIIILPEFNAIKMDGQLMRYKERRQIENAIKLLLFQYNKVHVEPSHIKLIAND